MGCSMPLKMLMVLLALVLLVGPSGTRGLRLGRKVLEIQTGRRQGRALLVSTACQFMPNLPWCGGTGQQVQNGGSLLSPSGSPSASLNTSSNASASTAGSGAPCPRIALQLSLLNIFDMSRFDSSTEYVMQCTNNQGQEFPEVTFPASSEVVARTGYYTYAPGKQVAELSCGQQVTCTFGYTRGGSSMETILTRGEGCTFDYRHFIQLSFKQPQTAWECYGQSVRYALQCTTCAQPNFPWDWALATSGPPLESTQTDPSVGAFNSVMVIVSVSVVSVAVLASIAAVVIRSRRRDVADAHLRDTVSQGGNRNRNRNEDFKPPELFVVDYMGSNPPSKEYDGPIVVLNCVEEDDMKEAQEGEHDDEGYLVFPEIAIAERENASAVSLASRSSSSASSSASRSSSSSSRSSSSASRSSTSTSQPSLAPSSRPVTVEPSASPNDNADS